MRGGFRNRHLGFGVLFYLSYVSFTNWRSGNVLFDDGELTSAIESTLSGFKGFSRTAERSFNREKDYTNPLNRDFPRIPGYLQRSGNSSIFGYVMRDLSNRLLPPSSPQQKRRRRYQRQSSPSNILVVCPEADKIIAEIKEKNVTTIASKNELIKSYRYRIGEAFLVESIYYGHDVIGVDSNTGMFDENDFRVSDITLAIFDPRERQEDGVISTALEEYIRSGIMQFATLRISSSLSSTSSLEERTTKNDDAQMRGLKASEIFFDAGYKLQVLSSSHAPTDGRNPYGPNTLLKDVGDVERFLSFGASLAHNAEHIRSSNYRSDQSTTSAGTPVNFHSILFATRGLDLAIPTRMAYLDLTGYGNDPVLNIEKDGIPYLNCPRSSGVATLRFSSDLDSDTYESNEVGDEVEMSCFGRKISVLETYKRRIDDGNATIFVKLWHSHNNISLSESACLKCTKSTVDDNKQNITGRVCTNRILSKGKETLDRSLQARRNEKGPNVLAIELRGVNRKMLKSSLARFYALSAKLGLEYYPDISPSTTNPKGNGDEKWWALWNSTELDSYGYQRYHASNQCVLPSHTSDNNSVLHHGIQMGGMFCFDYDRPNCLSGTHAATHLFNHFKKFIKLNREEKTRWASHITLIDGAEETDTLVGALDLPLSYFLSEVKIGMSSEEWSNTVITIFSNDVEEPILFLKASDNETRLLRERKPLFTSHLNFVLRSIVTSPNVTKAFHTVLAPDHVHMIDHSAEGGVHNMDIFDEGELVVPPSVLSFYADIPKEHKFQLIKSNGKKSPKRATVVKGCKCATNKYSWEDCHQHPWNNAKQDFLETYILVDCPDQPLHLEIKVIPNQKLIDRSRRRRNTVRKLKNIDIMFLELDSVSVEYADRHFPKTRELLKKYRIKRNDKNEYECINGVCSAEFPYTSLVGANSIPNQVAALSGCVSSTDQQLCGLVNASTGDICRDANMMHYGLRLERIRQKFAYWCPKRDLNETKTPWLFGVSDSKGYINFFGEEFCYDYSPYVTQGNVFPKFYQDIQSHHVFCSLVGRKMAMENSTFHRKHYWGVELSDPCIEGYACSKNSEVSTVSLQFMQQMWDAYANRPKLAFLNAMAAHDYSRDWGMMIAKAEAYDDHIHNFLKTMLSGTHRRRTVIIIRSDHGLQKGPLSMDFALQVEHRHPWTEVLVPESLVLSKSALFKNQYRMLTGYDLYQTMRLLMSDRTNGRNLEGGIPDWSFDILAEEISQNRTCEEAKVDTELCRKSSVKQTRQYGVCNVLDSSQARFCSKGEAGS